MPIYLCKLPHVSLCGVVAGENAADAVFKYDSIYEFDREEQQDDIEEAGSIMAYCEQLLTQYEVTELHRAMVLEYVERRLDGDKSITILL